MRHSPGHEHSQDCEHQGVEFGVVQGQLGHDSIGMSGLGAGLEQPGQGVLAHHQELQGRAEHVPH